METKYDLDDVLIVPNVNTDINSRDDINILYQNTNLPIIVAPMDTVVGLDNYRKFSDKYFNVCLPREDFRSEYMYPTNGGMVFYSFSLDEFENIFLSHHKAFLPKFILIDIANGHMIKLIESVRRFKSKYENGDEECFLMVGNVANPKTYTELSEAGADFIRIGIGNGNGCLTTQQTGVGYPMASLIHECHRESLKLANPAKIVADGGMKKYSDIIKSLALGADYVMLGSILNKSLESRGDTYLFDSIKINQYSKFAKFLFKNGVNLKKHFRGMSTKEVQKSWGKNVLRTSEGIVTKQAVEYSIDQWLNNFADYLKSCMSYTGCRNLDEFVGHVETIRITNNSLNRYKK